MIIDYYTLQRTIDSGVGVCPLKTCVTIIHHSFNNAPISVALLVCTFLYIRKDLLLGQAEASPTLVMSIKVFLLIYTCIYTMYVYIYRTSFRIYLSSISTICKFEQFMHMFYMLCNRERSRATETQEQRGVKLQRKSSMQSYPSITNPFDPVALGVARV